MSSKLLCMVCKTTQSQIWMGSDLVLPASKFTVLERLKSLRPQLQAFSILCTMCFSLVEHWDEQIAAAAKTEQVLRGLISSPHQHLNQKGECDDGSQEKGDGGHSAPLGDTVSVGEVKSPQSAGHSSYEELGVTEHPVTRSRRSNGEPPPRLSAGSNAAESELPETAASDLHQAAASDANLLGQNGLEVGEPTTASEAVLGDDPAALEVGALGLTLEEPAAQSDVPCEDDPVPDPVPPSEAERSQDLSGAGTGDATSDRLAPRSRRAAVAPPDSRSSSAPGAAVGRRHRCPTCGKAFARGGSLSDHLAAHAGTKAYACGECGERFQYRDGLLVHRRRQHGRGRLACPHCHVHFEKSCNLSRHLRVHTGERPYACAYCPKRFAQSNGLKKHVRSLHADQ